MDLSDLLAGDYTEGLHKARSGLIRALVKVRDGKIEDIVICGDFIMSPERYADLMEEALIGTPAKKDAVLKKLKEFYEQNKFQTPLTHPEDYAEAIGKALEASEK